MRILRTEIRKWEDVSALWMYRLEETLDLYQSVGFKLFGVMAMYGWQHKSECIGMKLPGKQGQQILRRYFGY